MAQPNEPNAGWTPALNLAKILQTSSLDVLQTTSAESEFPDLASGQAKGSRKGSNQAQTARTHKTQQQTGYNMPLSARTPSSSSKQSTPTITERGQTGDRSNPPNATPQAAPVSPTDAVRLYGTQMTDFEKQEVAEYQEVYFVGHNADKVVGSFENANNNNYDDDHGDYRVVMNDHILYRYEVVHPLGRGSFGQVVRVYDYKTGTFVALKIIKNKKRFHHQALIEVRILEHLKDHDPDDATCTIRMYEYFYFRNHLCITFELLSFNLYDFIKNNNFQGFSMGLIRRFSIQILTNLKYLYKHNIIHCDLKPENILLKNPQKSAIKVIDYGSSCFESERLYTYIQSRFYRSPEVILGLPYGTPIDMWSFGCILPELYTGYPIFPGENEVDQLSCMMEVLGLPPRSMVDTSKRRKIFFDSQGNPRIVPNSRGKKRTPSSKNLYIATRCNDPVFIDFLARCLDWDPARRMNPEEAMQHEWITSVCGGFAVFPEPHFHRQLVS
eukprot:TRINITY_DN4776_c0_g5_i2.p1 TRINITY_DN4776_c0_g5~~TRINITY_DN4776_c0_g5_i2.p1  ORF type:complete len:498 (-),score=82.56 TRINITY_DN4776_c0_g5_i2:798-2291(-)